MRSEPAATHIQSIRVRPYEDGTRIRVFIDITPFRVRPHMELTVTDPEGNEVAAASIVEPMQWNLEITLHLRNTTSSAFDLTATLFYPEGPKATPIREHFERIRHQPAGSEQP